MTGARHDVYVLYPQTYGERRGPECEVTLSKRAHIITSNIQKPPQMGYAFVYALKPLVLRYKIQEQIFFQSLQCLFFSNFRLFREVGVKNLCKIISASLKSNFVKQYKMEADHRKRVKK